MPNNQNKIRKVKTSYDKGSNPATKRETDINYLTPSP